MAKNGNKNNKENSVGLKTQTKHGIMAVIFFVAALFFLMSAFSITGVAGESIKNFFVGVLGDIGYFFLPTLLVLLGISYIKSKTPDVGWRSMISGAMFLLSGLGMLNIGGGKHAGGIFGGILSTPLVYLFDTYASVIFLGAILTISILILFDTKLNLLPFFKKLWALVTGKKESPVSGIEKEKIEENVETLEEEMENENDEE